MKKVLTLLVSLIAVSLPAWAQTAVETGESLHEKWTCFRKAGLVGRPPTSSELRKRQLLQSSLTREELEFAHEYERFVSHEARAMHAAGWIDFKNSINMSWEWYPVVGEYLDRHPELWHLEADALIYWALNEYWPGTTASPYDFGYL